VKLTVQISLQIFYFAILVMMPQVGVGTRQLLNAGRVSLYIASESIDADHALEERSNPSQATMN
jgi:hypothetical protein